MNKFIISTTFAALTLASPLIPQHSHAAEVLFKANQIQSMELATGNMLVAALGDIEKQLRDAERSQLRDIILRYICPHVGDLIAQLARGGIPQGGIDKGGAAIAIAVAVNTDRAMTLNSILKNGGKVDPGAMKTLEQKISLSKGVSWKQLAGAVEAGIANEKTRSKIFSR